jgi:hypothetical protein
MAPEREFAFQGYGMAVSGFLGNEPIPTEAICGIPSSGGLTRASQSDFLLDGILSVKTATAYATGGFDEDKRAWQSTVQVGVEGCNILDVVQADRITLILGSTYPERGGRPVRGAFGTAFEGFRIAGKSVRVELDGNLEQNGEARQIPGSLATRIKADAPGVHIEGNRITIPQFGTVRIAESNITRAGIQVTMLGVELQAHVRPGRIDLATAMLNGHPRPVRREIRPEVHRPQKESDEKLRMDEDELEEVLTELRLWVSSHPNPTEPFLFFMNETLSPTLFLAEVEERSRIGVVFLNILVDQAERSKQRPRQFIARAVEANQPR